MSLRAPERELAHRSAAAGPAAVDGRSRAVEDVRRPRAGTVTALRDVDVRGRAAARCSGIVGPVRLRQVHAAGADRRASGADRGPVAVAGAVGRRERLDRCVLMPQRDLLLPWRSALDNAALALELRRRRGARGARARALALFERFGLAGVRPRAAVRAVRRDAPARRLRAHAARRQAGPAARRAVRLARLDHPRRAAGVAGRQRSPTEPRTTLLVTHDIEEALYLCDRVLVLSRAPGDGPGRASTARSRPRRARARETVTSPEFSRAAPAGAGGAAHEAAGIAGLGPAAAAAGAARGRLGGWLARCGWVEDYLLPAPSEVARALVEDRDVLLPDAWVTAQEVLLGFALALAAGRRRRGRCCTSPPCCAAPLYPLVVASQAIPVIVIAPILVIWFGFGMGPKLIVIALICFFPIVVNTLDGLRAVDRDQVKMLRTLGAARWDAFRRLELPSSLPYLFSGAKMAVAVAVIGAVFGELVGSDAGPRARDPGRDGAAADRARVRGGADPGRDGDRAVRARVGCVERRAVPWAHSRSGGRRERAPRRAGAAALCWPACWRCRRRAARSPSRSGGSVKRDELRPRRSTGSRTPTTSRSTRRSSAATSARSGWTCKPQVPSDPAAPIKQVAAGRADLAISYEPEVLLAREQGLPVVAVAALVQRPLTSLMATGKSGVRSRAGPAREARRHRRHPLPVAYLKTILRRANVPAVLGEGAPTSARACCPRCCPGRSMRRSARSGTSRASSCASASSEPWIVPVDRLGVPDYDELVLVANADELDDQRDDLRLFISAVARGAREARRDPRGRPRRAARREPGPEARARPARACASRFPRCSPRRATARAATWTPCSGATTAAGWSTTSC